jgi:hypothetical protein
MLQTVKSKFPKYCDDILIDFQPEMSTINYKNIRISNPEVFLLFVCIFNYFCTLIFETQTTLPGLPKSIQQNIVNKSLEFQIIIIPLHPFLYQSGII